MNRIILPTELLEDLNEAAAALVTLPDGHRLAAAVLQGRDAIVQMNLPPREPPLRRAPNHLRVAWLDRWLRNE